MHFQRLPADCTPRDRKMRTSGKTASSENTIRKGRIKNYPGGGPWRITWTEVALKEAVTLFPSSSRSSSKEWRVT